MKTEITEKYDFRFKPAGYALVYIDETTGAISMQTDWGNYSHFWHKNGRGTDTLKQFLVNVGSDYLLNKFCHRSYFDVDATKKEMKKHVEEESWNLSEEEKKQCLEEIDEADFQSVDQVFCLLDKECETVWDKVYKGDLQGIPAYTDYKPVDRAFFEEIWPMIKAKLKEVVDGKVERRI